MANTNRWLGSRGVWAPDRINDAALAAYFEPRIRQAKTQLTCKLGAEGYAGWEASLPEDASYNRSLFLAHAHEKLAELADSCQDNGIAGACGCAHCTPRAMPYPEADIPY